MGVVERTTATATCTSFTSLTPAVSCVHACVFFVHTHTHTHTHTQTFLWLWSFTLFSSLLHFVSVPFEIADFFVKGCCCCFAFLSCLFSGFVSFPPYFLLSEQETSTTIMPMPSLSAPSRWTSADGEKAVLPPGRYSHCVGVVGTKVSRSLML